jgi:hypothetical protein
MTSDPLTKVMVSRPLLSLMSTGQVNFANELGHAIEARRLPKIKDFTEDDLELGDDKWLESYMTAEDLQAIQLYTTSQSTWTTSTGWNTKANFWLVNFLCFANVMSRAQPNKISDQAQCSADDFGGGTISRPAIRTGHHFVSHFGGDFLPLWSSMAFLEATVGHEDSFRRAHQQSFAAEHREVDRFGMSP